MGLLPREVYAPPKPDGQRYPPRPVTLWKICVDQTIGIINSSFDVTIVLLLVSLIKLDYGPIVYGVWFVANFRMLVGEFGWCGPTNGGTSFAIFSKFVLVNAVAYLGLKYLTTMIDPGLEMLEPKWFLVRLYLESAYHVAWWKAAAYGLMLVDKWFR